jgi:hypothetical protein
MNDRFIISAKPSLKNANPANLFLLNPTFSANQNLDFVIKGGTFFDLRNVYLSASNPLMFNNITYYNPFSGIKNLSANNIGFSAFLLSEFSYSENFISFTLPYIPKSNGFFDIIVENEAGYGKLSNTTVSSLTAGIRVIQIY